MNSASMRGDSEVRFVNLKKGYGESLQFLANSTSQFLSDNPLFHHHPLPLFYWNWQWEAEFLSLGNSRSHTVLLLWLLRSSSRSMARTLTLPLAPAEQLILSPPCFSLDLFTLHTTSNSMGTNPSCRHGEFSTLRNANIKTKLLKRNSVKTSSSFPRSSSSPVVPPGWMEWWSPIQSMVVCFFQVPNCRGTKVCAENHNPLYSLFFCQVLLFVETSFGSSNWSLATKCPSWWTAEAPCYVEGSTSCFCLEMSCASFRDRYTSSWGS